MLSDHQLERLLEIFLQRTQSVTEEYLIRMGEQIKDIGELIPSSVNRLVQLKRMNANLNAVKREIARLAEISEKDLEKVFEKAMETDARFSAQTFGNEYKPSILNNPALVQILKSQLNLTFGELANLSRTKISSEAYKKAIDKGISAVQMGMEDYNKAVRRALSEAAEAGIRVEIGKTGAKETRVGYGGKYTKRLDSAVRQNLLDGIRSLSNDVLWQLGEEYGADGVELSAHATCAEDHLPYQGKQYSMTKFEEIQESLPRPFGMWNCRHSIHPIVLGVSKPAYSDEELEAFRKNSTEKIEIDGSSKTRYQWTQEQRKIETAIRRQKDVAICAKAAGDTKLRMEAQHNITALRERYDLISEKAGLSPSLERMRVSGYKPMGKRELKKAENDGIISSNTVTKRELGDDVRVIGEINPSMIDKKWNNVKTTVVLTDERIVHIQEGHAQDYDAFGKYIPDAIKTPEYILEDAKNENTAMFVKHIENTNINVVVKLKYRDNDSDLDSSVITMYRLGEKTLKRLIKKNPIVYNSNEV